MDSYISKSAGAAVKRGFWSSPTRERLTTAEADLHQYLMTCQFSSCAPGFFQCNLKIMAVERGLTPEELKKELHNLVVAGVIDFEDSWILVKGWYDQASRPGPEVVKKFRFDCVPPRLFDWWKKDCIARGIPVDKWIEMAHGQFTAQPNGRSLSNVPQTITTNDEEAYVKGADFLARHFASKKRVQPTDAT